MIRAMPAACRIVAAPSGSGVAVVVHTPGARPAQATLTPGQAAMLRADLGVAVELLDERTDSADGNPSEIGMIIEAK